MPKSKIKALRFQPRALRLAPLASRLEGKGGFTIIELMVAMLLTAVIMLAVFSVYRVQTHSAKVQQNRLDAQEYARSVLDIMVREIRNAGYNPLGTPSPPTYLGTNCAGGLTGSPQVVSASATSLRFTYDFEDSAGNTGPDGNCNGPDEDITYTFQAPGPQNCPAGFGDITRNGSPLTNCNVPTGGSNFSLSYFKQDGTQITSNPLGALDLPNIQRVNISITVKSLNPDTEFGGQLSVTMTSNADLRNRGLPS